MDFEQFVRARSPTLARVAYLLTGDYHAAEDLLQETLARAAQRWGRITRHGADPEPYVRRILATRSIDAWRHQQRRPSLVTEVSTGPRPGPHRYRSDPASSVAASSGNGWSDPGRSDPGWSDPGWSDAVVLREALMRLTPRQRAVLVLRFFWDLTETQTAAAMDCSPNTVKSQTRHALQRLRELAPDLLAELRPEETR